MRGSHTARRTPIDRRARRGCSNTPRGSSASSASGRRRFSARCVTEHAVAPRSIALPTWSPRHSTSSRSGLVATVPAGQSSCPVLPSDCDRRVETVSTVAGASGRGERRAYTRRPCRRRCRTCTRRGDRRRSDRLLGRLSPRPLGCTDVVVLERDKLTSGTTWHAAGLMVTFGSTVGDLDRDAQVHPRSLRPTGGRDRPVDGLQAGRVHRTGHGGRIGWRSTAGSARSTATAASTCTRSRPER